MAESTPPRPVATDPATGLKTGTFAVGTFASGENVFPALVHPDGRVVDLTGMFRDLHEVLDDWDRSFAVLGDLATRSAQPVLAFEELQPLPPLQHPNLLAAGSNNRTHVAQMLSTHYMYEDDRRARGETAEERFQRVYRLMEERSRTGVPFLWAGLHSSLAGADDDGVLPVLNGDVDWELELGVVIGRAGQYVRPEDGQQMIAGYTIVNDLGDSLARRTDIPFGFDFIGKHHPTFKPCGPFVVPAQFLDVDETVRITLSVNGEVMQDWRADDWIFSPAEYVSYASERVRLLPGDIIAMGSPPGNASFHGGRFQRDGDVIDSAITYLGRQRNRCVAENRDPATLRFGHWSNVEPGS